MSIDHTGQFVPEIHGFVGFNRSGKSFLARHKAKPFKRQIRIVANRGDTTWDEGADFIAETPRQLLDYVKSKRPDEPFIVSYKCAEYVGELHLMSGKATSHVMHYATAFETALKVAFFGKYILVIADEAHRYLDRNFAKTQPHAATIITQGFHVKCHFMWTATFPRELPPSLRGQSNYTYIFDSHEPTYEGYMLEVASKKDVQQLHAAPKYSYLETSRFDPPIVRQPFKLGA